MAFIDNKQEAFQSAHQGVAQASEAFAEVDPDSSYFGQQVKNTMQEINEAIQQIEKAAAAATDRQRVQLMGQLDELTGILHKLNNM